MSEAPMHRCQGACGRELPRTPQFFGKNSAVADGMQKSCLECVRAIVREAARRRRSKRPLKTPWGEYRKNWLSPRSAPEVVRARDPVEEDEDLSPLETTLDDVRPHLSGVMRDAPRSSLGDED
jgi:hypothetical protein